eukprot:TRINITY_DN10899_c0_g1_i1.p2 TRINITY_DN10899_c0_g1~~TRINITY_DN10899_c0_g1_i1.p2  ORF type:complete len:164 (+),score=2.63 TRINITY_DN10899_c0_g1_i1:82-573(+)
MCIRDSRNSIRMPMDYVCEGFAVDKATEIIYLVDNQGAISAYRISGELLWQSSGRGPLMTYDKYLIAVSDNYQSIMMLDKATGKTLSRVELPALLPRFENSFAIISSVSDAMLIMSIPQQSRLLCYRITPQRYMPERVMLSIRFQYQIDVADQGLPAMRTLRP